MVKNQIENGVRVLTVPVLNGLKPTLLSTLGKAMEELGEFAQVVGKLGGLNGEIPVDRETYERKMVEELFDLIQVTGTLSKIVEDEYGIDLSVGAEIHLQKLKDKGYLK